MAYSFAIFEEYDITRLWVFCEPLSICLKISCSCIAGYGRPKYDTEVKLGWIKSGDKWYYRIAPGQNAHGWVKIKNADGKTRWYHFKSNGEMDKGWTVIDGNKYYLEESGDLEGACYITDQYGVQRIWVVE